VKKIFLLALIIRLICLYLFINVINYDLKSYIQVGELTLKGINIYPKVANLHHPYLPFFLYFEAVAVWLSESKIMALAIIKIINILFDIGILYLVYLLSKKKLKTTFIYAMNPVTILITTLHGQFDVIPVFFILLAIYLLNKKQELLSVLSFSLAVLTKTWPILFLIPILRKVCICHPRENGDPERLNSRRSLSPNGSGNETVKLILLLTLILIFPILFTIIYCLFFKTNPIDIGKTLTSYQGLWGIWGPWQLLGKTRILWQKLSTFIFLVSFFGYSLFNKDKNLIKNILSLLFFFFIFTTNFSIQYLAWITPFLILIRPKKYIQLIIFTTLYLILFYCVWLFNLVNIKVLTLIQNIVGFMLWFSFVKIWYLSK
jgi:hypothetical protein